MLKMTMLRFSVGFTLVEFLVSLLVLSLGLAIAIPNMQIITRRARIDSETSALLHALQFARSEAIKRGQPVSITAPNAWSQGLTVFVDPDASLTYDSQPVLMKLEPPRELSVAVQTSALTNGVIFTGLGSSAKTL